MTNKRRIKRLEEDCKTLAKEQTNLTMAYGNLTTTATEIDGTIQDLKKQDFTPHRKMIDSLKLDDTYRESLKVELENSRTLAIQTLEPLREKTEKLRGHMMVAQTKALHYLAVVRAQTDILKAGEIQVEVVNSLREQGAELNERVGQLLAECERINGITRNAVQHVTALAQTTRLPSYLQADLLVEKHGS
jgi:uncharacterized coiled-coil DUF342 family protein